MKGCFIMKNLTESSVTTVIEPLADTAFSNYLIGAGINIRTYKDVTGSSLHDVAVRGINDNADTLLELAKEDGIDVLKSKIQSDGNIQDFLYAKYLDLYNDDLQDLKKSNRNFVRNKILNTLRTTMEDDGITEILFVKTIGSSYATATRDMTSEYLQNNPEDIDIEVDGIDRPMISEMIYPFEARINNYAGEQVVDMIMDKYQVKDQSLLAKVNGNDIDNNRVASGTLPIEKYVAKNIPELEM